MESDPLLFVLGNSPVYLLGGNRELLLQSVCTVLERSGIVIRGNPDVVIQHFPAFGIKDALQLNHYASLTSISGERRVFVVSAGMYTDEAQNALLKSLEEPLPGTTFVLLADQLESFLPTVRSRGVKVVERKALLEETKTLGKTFLSLSISERFAFIAPILALREKDDLNEKGKARDQAIALLDSLVLVLANESGTERVMPLRHLLQLRKAIAGRSPILKHLLEYLSLTLPFRATEGHRI